ncbi:MAG: hypothetical protein J7K22_03290 [Nanoarchaeota archaeon]|nr:hypothetical protein [Nanoarchaeota archaeon]
MEGIQLNQTKKRNVAIEKRISQITKDDIRVKMIGTVIEKDPVTNSIVIDDGESTIRVLLDKEVFDEIETGKLIRVIGIVVPALEGESFELKGEIIQDFSKLNPELYAKYLKVKDILNKG